MKDLKAYHAYYIMALVWLITCVFMKSFAFFPIACCFVCVAMVSKAREEGKLPEKRKKR